MDRKDLEISYWMSKALFKPKFKKKKRKENPFQKECFIFQEMEISSSSIKTFLIFSYILRNGKPSTLPPPSFPPPREKKFHMFLYRNSYIKVSYILGYETFHPKLKNIKKIHPRNCLTLPEK